MLGHPTTRVTALGPGGSSHPVFDRTTWAALVIGIALSGFFDGILLHQVLQWHHLLSLVPGEAYRDLRTQVLADGLFHAVMFALALIGLWMLWRARSDLDRSDASRRVVGGSLLGFGVWNILDVGLFHWILGLHRIRVNVPDPMLYDVAWFAGPGIAVAAAGWLVLRGARGGGEGGSRQGRRAAATVATALLLAAPVAQIPVPGGSTLVVFDTGMNAAGAINAVVASGGRLIALDPAGRFAVVKLPARSASLALYRNGAVLVTGSAALAGCFAFTQAG